MIGEDMAETKYGRYFNREPFKKPRNPEVTQPMVHLNGERDGEGADITISISFITQPFRMIKEAHKHDRDQFIIFMGNNPDDVNEFGAEIEMTLGPEGEKHIVNTPTVLHIPKGLIHGPLDHKKIDKPIRMVDIYLGPVYVRQAPTE
jgi:hypothetical protein